MDTQVTEVTASQKQLVAKSAKILLLSGKHTKLTDKLGCLKSQNEAEDTVPEDLKLIAKACERSTKRAEVSRRCKGSSATLSTAVFLALLAYRNDFKNFCVALTLKESLYLCVRRQGEGAT